jgi:predicted nucleic acid-binding protein
MILADTCIWIDHLRQADFVLQGLLRDTQILVHPIVIGEIALGSHRERQTVLNNLTQLPRAVTAGDEEVLALIETHQLFGTGIGYPDAQLLASVKLTPHASLWTRDKRLCEQALRLGVAFAGR